MWDEFLVSFLNVYHFIDQNHNQNVYEFIWHIYCQVCTRNTYEEFVFGTEATAVQQNDSDGTKNTDNKKKNEKEQVNKEKQYTNGQLYVQVYKNGQCCMCRYIMCSWSVD